MPGFVGGLAEGLQGLPAEVGQLLENMRTRKAAEALMNTYGAQGQQPQGQPPQGAPPQQGGPASLAALAPQPQAAPFTPGKPPAPGQPDPLAPQPAAPPPPPPGAPTGAPGAEAPTGMAVDSRYPDPVKEAQSLNANLWKAVKAANPKADPLTIMRAVQMQIEQIKGVAPITKSAMQGQLAMLHENIKAREFEQRETRLWKDHADKLNLAYKSDNWKQAVAEENTRFKGEMVSVAQDRARIYEESTEDQHKDRESAETGRDSRFAEGEAGKDRRFEEGESGKNSRTEAQVRSKYGPAVASAFARIKASGQYQGDDDTLVQSLQGMVGGGGGSPASPPAPKAGPTKQGGVPANVQQFAKQHGLQVIRKRADGKWDAKAKDGTVGVIG